MITSKEPTSWKDLQNKVGDILKKCGFNVEIEKEIPSVRGKVEIDVYAEEEINGRTYSIICECKYWETSIPQNVIHGFRTVINDLGCNIGYIITTSKYQSGSKQSVEKTNIQLLTWQEFQNLFFENWYANYFCNTIQDEIKLPVEFSWVEWFDDLDQNGKHLYNKIKNRLTAILDVQANFPRSFLKAINPDYFVITKLPLGEDIFEMTQYSDDIPEDILNETDYQEFLDKFIIYSTGVISEFKDLEQKYSSK